MAMAVAAGMLLIAGVACSSDPEPKGPTATVGTLPPTTTSTTTLEDVKAQVEAAYLEAEAAYYEAIAEPDPSDPRLAVNRTGDNARSVVQYAASLVELGHVVRYPSGKPAIDVKSIDLGPDGRSATLVSCIIDGSEIVDQSSGEVVDSDVATWHQEFDLVLRDAAWAVSSGRVLDNENGGEACE